MRLLVCEDDAEISKHLREILEPQNFDMIFLTETQQVEQRLDLKDWSPDVVVLDRLFGSDDLVHFVEPMKETWPSSKILILSAIDTPLEKAQALEKGADDYLAKPFTKEELLARIRALHRRSRNQLSKILVKGVELDLEDRILKFAKVSLELSLKECELLKLFFLNPGQVFSKEDLVQKIWKTSPNLETNTVESTLARVRRKLEDVEAPLRIKNMRFTGYWLEV